jgi:hypothetical protein
MFNTGHTNTIVTQRESVEDKKRLYELERQRKQDNARDRRQAGRGGLAGLGDTAVGDENNDITMADVRQYKDEQDKLDTLKARFNVWALVFAGVLGGLLGSILGAMQIQKMFRGEQVNYEAATNTMIGSFAGIFCSVTITAFWQCASIYLNKNGRFQKQLDAEKEALRRKEQSMMERHDEFIYYDAQRAQSRFYRIFCCSHYGKITSERIIYSSFKSPSPMKGKGCKDYCIYACEYVKGYFIKDVESLDYDYVLDVSVDQSCTEQISNVGNIQLHCEASSDLSVIKSERQRIVRALKAQNEGALRKALLSAGNIRPLRKLINRAKNEIVKLQERRREECKKAGQEFIVMYVEEDNKQNTSKLITVRDVVNPYSVMDDISYRIAKSTKSDIKAQIIKNLESSSEMFGNATEFLSEPEVATAINIGGVGHSKTDD